MLALQDQSYGIDAVFVYALTSIGTLTSYIRGGLSDNIYRAHAHRRDRLLNAQRKGRRRAQTLYTARAEADQTTVAASSSSSPSTSEDLAEEEKVRPGAGCQVVQLGKTHDQCREQTVDGQVCASDQVYERARWRYREWHQVA